MAFSNNLCYLNTLTSSDGKINHTFECDRLGRLLNATDEVQKVTIQRKLDPFGNIIKETLPNDLEITKEYDDSNRKATLKINGHEEILYEYDPLFLRSIKRISPNGQTLYEHT